MFGRGVISVFLIGLLALCAGTSARAEPRIALVVTNQSYKQSGAALTNTHRDGDLVKAALEKVGFKVWVVRDTPSEAALIAAIGEHVARLAKAGPDAVGFVYYSGHGAADRPDGANYLIPTEAPLTHVSQLPLMAVRLDKITETLASVGRNNFVVFDACRNVALERDAKSASFKGFAPIKEQSGLLVAYATEPGNIAVDQSIYAKALAEEIVQPGREASSAFRAVARRVIHDSGQRQKPQYLDRRLDDFHFTAPAPLPPPQQQVAVVSPSRPLPSKPAAPAAVITPPGCGGIEVEVAGTGRRCIDPADRELKKREFQDCRGGICAPVMVLLPTGSYLQGDETKVVDGVHRREVRIGDHLAVGKFEVTFDEWDACVSDGGCNTRPDDEGWGRSKRPVINVSWNEITGEYLPWLNRKLGLTGASTYRLLTEAEWEYAARGVTTASARHTRYSWGDEIDCSKASYDGGQGSSCFYKIGQKPRGTQTVGSYTPNAFGLHDMHGNVWEWVQDCYAGSYKDALTDGKAVPDKQRCTRVLRGGSWGGNPELLRSANRGGSGPGLQNIYDGFRVARSVSG